MWQTPEVAILTSEAPDAGGFEVIALGLEGHWSKSETHSPAPNALCRFSEMATDVTASVSTLGPTRSWEVRTGIAKGMPPARRRRYHRRQATSIVIREKAVGRARPSQRREPFHELNLPRVIHGVTRDAEYQVEPIRFAER